MGDGTADAYIRVRNWDRYQHYRDGRPLKWIKLWLEILDDYEMASLPDEQKWHAVGLLVLAGKHDNEIPADPEWIGRRINATHPVDLEAFEEIGLTEPHMAENANDHGDVQNCTEEYETVQSSRERVPARSRSRSSSPSISQGGKEEPEKPSGGDVPPEHVRQVLDYLNDLAGTSFQPGHDTEYLEERLAEDWGLEACELAVEAALDDPQIGTHPRRVFSRECFADLVERRRSGKLTADAAIAAGAQAEEVGR